MRLRVFRYEPGVLERMQEYRVEAKPGMTVLDALVGIQQRQDPTLAFRYACRVGMCGSCTMVVNGRERWACRTLLSTLKGKEVRIHPLYHFPLIRDLVVDMAPFAEKMTAVHAAFVPGASAPEFATIGATSQERREIDPTLECIDCGACLSACTTVAHNPRFPGPAALNRAFTLMADPGKSGGLATVSAGIAEALLTTAAGLAVAIVTVWLYNFFVTQVDAFTVDLFYARSGGTELAGFVAQAVHLADTCESRRQALEDCLAHLTQRQREQQLASLRERIQHAELTGNQQELQELLHEVAGLTKRGDTQHGHRESASIVQQAR
jgi:succinate dehydrogenase/fumarate reductase iron-sulfur protein